MRLGVLGGTFDPVHLGHLVLAEEAREQLGLERVLFVPAGQPWRKAGRQISTAEDRLAMLRLALRTTPRSRSAISRLRGPGRPTRVRHWRAFARNARTWRSSSSWERMRWRTSRTGATLIEYSSSQCWPWRAGRARVPKTAPGLGGDSSRPRGLAIDAADRHLFVRHPGEGGERTVDPLPRACRCRGRTSASRSCTGTGTAQP